MNIFHKSFSQLPAGVIRTLENDILYSLKRISRYCQRDSGASSRSSCESFCESLNYSMDYLALAVEDAAVQLSMSVSVQFQESLRRMQVPLNKLQKSSRTI